VVKKAEPPIICLLEYPSDNNLSNNEDESCARSEGDLEAARDKSVTQGYSPLFVASETSATTLMFFELIVGRD
jgi:hypothetical protein